MKIYIAFIILMLGLGTYCDESGTECPSIKDGDSLSQTQLIQRLTHPCRYDRLERPPGSNSLGPAGPVEVIMRAYIYFMQNPEANDFKIHALLTVRYNDTRLAFDKSSPKRTQPILGEDILRNAIWVPHIFLANEKDSSILGTPKKDVLTSISPNGTIIIATRIEATIYCTLDLEKFPFDSQHCSTVIESWMYNTTELMLHWEQSSPITFDPDMHLLEYMMVSFWTNESIINADMNDLRHGAFVGNYSSLSFSFHLNREVGYYLMEYFIPSMMIISISWVTFWLQADQTAPRMMLGANTLLSFITLSTAQENSLPKVSYIKVSEIWFLVGTGFIIASLAEFAFVNTIWRRQKNVELKKAKSKYILKSTFTPKLARKDMQILKSRSCASLENQIINRASCSNCSTDFNLKENDITKNQNVHFDLENGTESNSIASTSSGSEQNLAYKWTTMTPQEISIWIDKRSRVVFPMAFLLFNALFWTFVYVL